MTSRQILKEAIMTELQETYFIGRLHENMLQIKNDLHMGDAKSALLKVNDAIKLIEDKVQEHLPTQKETMGE